MTVEPMTDAELAGLEDRSMRLARYYDSISLPARDMTRLLARLAAARAEGYREGVEAAIADAVAVSIRDEVDSYEMRDDGGGGYSPTDDERIMLEDFGAGLVAVFEQRLRALTPPSAAWTPTHRHYKGALYRVTKRGKRIWAGNDEQNGSMLVEYDNAAGGEFALPEADFDSEVEDGVRRYAPLDAEPAEPSAPVAPEDVAALEHAVISGATRIIALEAENAALREVFDAACAMDGFGMFDDLESPSGVRMREATRRARALFQGQGGGDAEAV